MLPVVPGSFLLCQATSRHRAVCRTLPHAPCFEVSEYSLPSVLCLFWNPAVSSVFGPPSCFLVELCMCLLIWLGFFPSIISTNLAQGDQDCSMCSLHPLETGASPLVFPIPLLTPHSLQDTVPDRITWPCDHGLRNLPNLLLWKRNQELLDLVGAP